MKYRAEIDGLRALAVVPVILFHAGFHSFSGGFVGVDVFFVISGYLITTILADDIERKRFSIIKFYERRARRILPALFVVVLACLPFAWVWMLPDQMKDFAQSILAVSLFASNILFVRESDYFAAAAEEKPLLHTWSLAVEEQYYLLFPVFLVLAWRFGKNKVFWMIVVAAAGSLVASEWGWRFDPTWNFYLAPFRAWELFAGSIAAFIAKKHGIRSNNPLSMLGLAAIIFSIFFYDTSTPFPSVYALVPVVGVVLLVLYGNRETIAAKILSAKVFVGIGLISYSAYLWHQPLFAFARIRSFETPGFGLRVGLAAASIVLAWLNWKYVETPFRKRDVVTNKKLLAFVAVFFVVMLSIGVAGHKSQGFEDYLLTPEQRAFMATAVSNPRTETCASTKFYTLDYTKSCTYGGEKVDVAVLGDSHSSEVAFGVAQHLEKEKRGIRHLSYLRCAPSVGANFETYELCTKWTNEVFAKLLEDASIHTVVVSYRMAGYLYGWHEHTYPHQVDDHDDAYREKVWGTMIGMLEALQAAGKKVVYVRQVPELPKRIGFLVPKGDETPVGVPRRWWDERSRYEREHIDTIPEGVVVVDPTPLLCDEKVCRAGTNDTAYYFDDNHLSQAGSVLLAEEIFRRLQ